MSKEVVADGIKQNVGLLEQLGVLLSTLSVEDYTTPLVVLRENTLGGHFRHVLEFYEIFLRDKSEGICYDIRQRSKRLEQEPSAAKKAMEDTIGALWTLEDADEEGVDIKVEGRDKGSFVCASTLSRELFYLADHTTHHMAILQMAISVAFPNVPLPESFGVAKSTLQYRSLVSTPSDRSKSQGIAC